MSTISPLICSEMMVGNKSSHHYDKLPLYVCDMVESYSSAEEPS